MRFGVSYGNHGDGIHVEDVLLYIRNALIAGGEDAYLLPGLLTDGINVITENFTPEHAWQIRQLRRRSRARFVVVVSEFTDGKRFNAHITSGEGVYVDAPYWQKRFDVFLEIAAESDAIWSLSDYTVPDYRSLFPDKPVLALPIGFDPVLAHLPQPAPDDRDIDLLFTGSRTPHREALLTALQERHLVMTAPVNTLSVSRADFIRRAKVSLHLNLQKNAMYSSVMRHHFLVMNGAAVVSERAQTIGPLDDFITQFDGDTLVEDIGAYLARGDWRHQGVEMRERYREARPIASAMRELVKESLR